MIKEKTTIVKAHSGDVPLVGKEYFRFMKDYFTVKFLLGEWGSYKVAMEKLNAHNKMSDQCDFNFGCLCGTLFRVSGNKVALSHFLEYYDESNNFVGIYEVV